MSRSHLGNAYNNLGNDYSALCETGRRLDVDAFRCAIAAYRRALSYRSKSADPIEWARTQFNIATNYGRACSLGKGVVARRYGHAALARFDLALSVLSPRNSPHDWASCSFQMASAVAQLVDAGFNPGIAVIESAIVKLADVGDFGDHTGDVALVMQALDMQAGFMRHLFAQRGPDAHRLIALGQARIEPRRRLYVYTPLRLFFVLAYNQAGFMLAHLAHSRPGMEKAIAAVEGCVVGPSTENEANFVALAVEALIEMRETRNQMTV